MSAKSKSDILKRYLSASTSDANADGLRKKKKRKKQAASVTSGVRVVEEDEWGGGGVARAGGVDEEVDDDGPLIVDDKGDQVASLEQRQEEARKRPRQEDPDASPPRRKRHDSPDASPPRRTRHDSPDASPPRRKRHDSPAADASPPRRKRHDSPDASHPRRKRHDSPDADASPPRRKRHDSPDTSPPRRKRHDSPAADASPPRRKRHDSPEPEPEPEPKVKEVGLKTGAEFKKEFEAKKAEEARRWAEAQREQGAAELTGQNAETVVRDRRGRKLEMLSEFMNQEAFREGKEAKQAKEEYEWGRGLVQKEKDAEFRKELEDIKNAPFARYESDPKLERMRKEEIRADDPMAEYMMKKQRKAQLASGVKLKPEYKGPPARPNRFNLKPGYRWDGIDRGNGFEQRWFKRQAELKSNAESDRLFSMSEL